MADNEGAIRVNLSFLRGQDCSDITKIKTTFYSPSMSAILDSNFCTRVLTRDNMKLTDYIKPTWSCLSQWNLRRTDVGTNACEMTGFVFAPELFCTLPLMVFASDILGYLNKSLLVQKRNETNCRFYNEYFY